MPLRLRHAYTSAHRCGIQHGFYSSIRYIFSGSLVLVVMLHADAAHCKLFLCDPVDLSFLWLRDVRPLMCVSAPGACRLAGLLMYTVNPSC